MAKFNAKNLVVIIIFGILLIGTVAIVNAQQALPKGGDSFGTAVEIQAGSYITDHDISRKTLEYFKLPVVKAGQMLIVKATNLPTGVDIVSMTVLYDEDRAMLVPSYDNPLDLYGAGETGTYNWLTNSSQDSYVYYMSVGGGVNFIAEGTKYDISIEDRFDAGSQADAPDTFDKAMNINSGEYKAYLSGEAGIDTKDFYKTTVQKGETLTVKVTPEGDAIMRVTVYDNNRQVLKDEYAPNPGAIITNSVARTKTGDVLIAVVCEEWCSENITTYTLSIAKEVGAPVGEEEEEEVLPGESTGWPIGEGLTEEGAEEAAKGFFKVVIMAWLLPLVVGLITLVVVIVVIVVLVRKKKK